MADPVHVVLGVGGSIAAVKAPLIVTEMRRRGWEVRVALTEAAQHFVTDTSLRSLSGAPVVTSRWLGVDAAGMPHLDLAAWAHLVVVAPASANLLARLAAGMADDPVAATVLASTGTPLLLAPAMETAMWSHPATRANVERLVSWGARLVGPESGRLASGHEGAGRMAEVGDIVAAAAALIPA